jgi:LmbE family N-acetylglucosaminyl deacetylase
MKTEAYQHIYLSPHLDDVVLSCGGMIYEQGQAGEKVLVVSFFAGSPEDDSLNDYTRELKARWGGAADPVAVRRQEDVTAVAVLGAAYKHLSFLDCVYRGGVQAYYPSVEHIFGPVHPAEEFWHQALATTFRAEVGDFAEATLYAPLATGHHVDHILVQRAALGLCAQKQRVCFYEDYPYAGDARAVGAALAAAAEMAPGRRWRAETRFFSGRALRAKGEAVACYVSQISTFWPNAETMRQALRRQALVVGQGRYGENLWRIELSHACGLPDLGPGPRPGT